MEEKQQGILAEHTSTRFCQAQVPAKESHQDASGNAFVSLRPG